jgi:hypothetical protein
MPLSKNQQGITKNHTNKLVKVHLALLSGHRRKETPVAQAAAIIALSERLRRQSRKTRNHKISADLRLATRYLRVLAALRIAEEAEAETEHGSNAQLEREFIQLYSHSLRLH